MVGRGINKGMCSLGAVCGTGNDVGPLDKPPLLLLVYNKKKKIEVLVSSLQLVVSSGKETEKRYRRIEKLKFCRSDFQYVLTMAVYHVYKLAG